MVCSCARGTWGMFIEHTVIWGSEGSTCFGDLEDGLSFVSWKGVPQPGSLGDLWSPWLVTTYVRHGMILQVIKHPPLTYPSRNDPKGDDEVRDISQTRANMHPFWCIRYIPQIMSSRWNFLDWRNSMAPWDLLLDGKKNPTSQNPSRWSPTSYQWSCIQLLSIAL